MQDFFDKFIHSHDGNHECFFLEFKSYSKVKKDVLIRQFKELLLPKIIKSNKDKGFMNSLDHFMKNINKIEYIIFDLTDNRLILQSNKHQLAIFYPDEWKIEDNLK